ncbi:DUF2437 domain-containing protein, partial [Patescibacteria group bacterium]|nr:DUF2437 domain-containing protein [Patescibacteria group bacterium]
MQIIRYQQKNTQPQYGWINVNEGLAGPLSGAPFGAYRRLEAAIPLKEVTLLPPCQPSKVLAVGRNYPEHAREHGVSIPDVPLIFTKPLSAIIGPGETILLPPQSQR